MRQVFRWATAFAAIAVVAGLGWLAYGRFNTSAAAEFDESISMVNHQTSQMSTSLGEAGSFVNSEVSRITDLSILLTAWTPRFNSAQTSYHKFDAAIIAAETQAEVYFADQRALTERFNDPELRRAAESTDEGITTSTQWKNRSSVREEALSIVTGPVDTSAEVEVGFRILLRSKRQKVPADILALEDELAHFKIASENIRAITKSPFEPSQ